MSSDLKSSNADLAAVNSHKFIPGASGAGTFLTNVTPGRSRASRGRSEAANPFDRKQSHNLPSIDVLARTEDKGRYGKDSKINLQSTKNIDSKKITIDTSPKATELGDDFAKFHM